MSDWRFAWQNWNERHPLDISTLWVDSSAHKIKQNHYKNVLQENRELLMILISLQSIAFNA